VTLYAVVGACYRPDRPGIESGWSLVSISSSIEP
jgi:hypothetical protein